MKKLLLAAYFATICATANAQPYIDSFNINTAGVLNNSSYPNNLCAYGNTLYFSASDSTHGSELWVKYPGSPNPDRLTDIMKGVRSSVYTGFSSIAVLNNAVYFVVNDSAHGAEIWYYYPGGGHGLLKDINEGAAGSFSAYLTPYNNRLYFSAYTRSHGMELWMHEPGSGKTERLSDINADSLSSYLKDIVAFNGKIYFQAFEKNTGAELYMYDPATNTTQIAADIRTGNMGSSPANFHVMDNKLYFTANDGTTGSELYVYDGTTTPTRLTDLNPGAAVGVYQSANLEHLNGILYFNGNDGSGFQLFKYDPASNTASLVHTINPSGTAYINELTRYNNALFFSANDGTHGVELWKYDGTNTPAIVVDLYPGPIGSYIDNITYCGLNLYFTGRNVTYGLELFRYSDYPAGVENVTRTNNVKLYPNPVTDIAHLEIDLKQNQTLEVVLTDMQGRVVYKTDKVLYSAAKHIIDIPVYNLPAGNYMYSLQGSNGSLIANGKLVKE